MKRTTRRRIGLAAIIIGLIMIMGSGCSSNASKDPAGTVITVQQPLTAHQVADKIGCTEFLQGAQPKVNLFAVIDSGACWLDGSKYGIDTFASTAARDRWTKGAADLLGVVPKWETADAVIYPSQCPHVHAANCPSQESDGYQPNVKKEAAKYSCVNFKYDHYSRTGGECQLHGRTVEIETFRTKEARDVVVNALKEVGPYAFVVKTDHVIITYPKI